MRRLQFLRSHFFAGLLVVIPLGVISWILLGSLKVLWGVHLWFPAELQLESILGNRFAATDFESISDSRVGAAPGYRYLLSGLGFKTLYWQEGARMAGGSHRDDSCDPERL